MKKKLISFLLALSIFGAVPALAHPGRTDSSGGHYVRKSGWGYPVGSYHYHNGGSASSSNDSYSAPAAKPSKVLVEVEKIYIFQKTSAKSKSVGIKSRWDKLDYKGKNGNWYKVSFYNPSNKYTTGYVHKNNVSIEYE